MHVLIGLIVKKQMRLSLFVSVVVYIGATGFILLSSNYYLVSDGAS